MYSFVTYCRAWHPPYEDKVPYNVSFVDLDEGPRSISNVIDCRPDQVKMGMAVELVYEDNESYTYRNFAR